MLKRLAVLVLMVAACGSSDDAPPPVADGATTAPDAGAADSVAEAAQALQEAAAGDVEASAPVTEAGEDASACAAVGAICSGLAAADPCCSGSVCVSDSIDPNGGACEPTCLQATDCATGCCVQYLPAGKPMNCYPAEYCGDGG